MTNEQELSTAGDSPAIAAVPGNRVNGPAVAATLAAGIGSLALGIFVVLAEASTSMHDFLEFSKDVGPLAGKTILAVIVYLVSWGILHVMLKARDVAWKPAMWATGVMVALGLLFTFPPFFQMFTVE
ncbi:MAG: hypothetical protein HZB14_03840 [Actinobacteria bacterium]|nr:hypothetical protein [Actinomycetota bacterium]